MTEIISHRSTQARVAILVCTFRRPELLKQLLHSIEVNGSQAPFDCIVVDNDPYGSAKDVCDRSPVVSNYRIEPQPGISYARNCGIEMALEYEYLIFVDDDETVCKRWVDLLLAAAAENRAEGVAGPVLSNLAENCPKWIRESGLFDRTRYKTGTERPEAGSGNLLLETSIFNGLDRSEWFLAEFGLTGGGDAELTRRLVKNGTKIVWCDEAWAIEDVPLERTCLRWLIRRQMRLASVDYALQAAVRFKRLRAIISGIARILLGGVGMVLEYARTNRIDSSKFRMTFRGVGFIRAAFGATVVEYKR